MSNSDQAHEAEDVHLDGAGEPVAWMQPCGPVSLDDLLGRAYLEAAGMGSIIDQVHPADEMLTNLQVLTPPERSPRVEYFKSGFEPIVALENLLGSAGRRLEDVDSLLEFACGYGRVTRHLVNALGADRVVGCEILPQAVPFVGTTFGVHTVQSTPRASQLELGGPFELIFVGSLFSHLPRRRFVEWLAKLYEALTPTGLLVFSTHGEKVYPDVKKHRSGFTFIEESESRALKKSEYGATFVSPAVVAKLSAEAGVRHVVSLERDLWKVQDLHVASRAPVPGLGNWTSTSYVRGSIDLVHLTPKHRLRAYGWAADPSAAERIEEVELLLNGHSLARTEVTTEREDVVREYGRDDLLHSGWFIDVDPSIAAGPHVLTARGRSTSGRDTFFDARLIHVGNA